MRLFCFYFIQFSFVAQRCLSFDVVPSERAEFHFPQLVAIIEALNDRSPDLLTSRLDLEEATANQKIAASERGLKIGLNISGQSIHEDRPNQGYEQRYRALGSLYLRKSIFHWGALLAKENISKIDKLQANSNLIAGERMIIGEVRSQFLDLAVLSFRGKLAKEGSRLASQNLNDLKQRQKVGFNSTIEVEEAEAEYLNRQIEVAEIKFLLSKEESIFRTISGHGEVISFKPNSSFLKFCREHDFSQKVPPYISGATSSEIDTIHGLIEKENNRIIISKSNLKPKLNLSGSYYQDQVDALSSKNNLDRNNLVVGLEANWALWDSGKSNAEITAAHSRKRKYEIQLERANRDLRMLFDELRQELESLKERISLSRKLLDVAINRFDKASILFQQDRLSSTDLFSAQLALDNAKLGNFDAVCKYLKTLDQYEQYIDYSSQSSPVVSNTNE